MSLYFQSGLITLNLVLGIAFFLNFSLLYFHYGLWYSIYWQIIKIRLNECRIFIYLFIGKLIALSCLEFYSLSRYVFLFWSRSLLRQCWSRLNPKPWGLYHLIVNDVQALSNFKVLEFNEFSDHSPLYVCFKRKQLVTISNRIVM